MSKELLEPPDEKAAPLAPTKESPHPPLRETEPAGTKPVASPPPAWRRLSRGRYLAGGGIVLAIALVIVLLVVALGAPSKTSTTTSSIQIKQVTMPAHQTYDAQAPAAPQGDTVDINLVVKETLISIAPGIAYHAYTFNGTVPGPILRVRQGQTIHFTLTNDGTMPHSIDFHAAQTPWNVNYQPIAPGKSFSFDWKANYPGVFMYHCGAPLVIAHMANGMYGAIIVDPANGWTPAQEYVLVQSEFYTAKALDGSYYLDLSKTLKGTPDYVVFNGYANQYRVAPLEAKAGQRIRLFIIDAGPTLFSAFHVIGALFSDTYADGNPANHMQGNQTITIPPGGGYVVELTIPDPGSYPFVTHSFADVGLGAVGVIKITQ
jgi:nitrite reductase (NO-forming)